MNSLPDASQLGTVSDVQNLIGIFGNAMQALIPFFTVMGVIYVVRMINLKHKREKERQKQAELIRQQQLEMQKKMQQQRIANQNTSTSNNIAMLEESTRLAEEEMNRYRNNSDLVTVDEYGNIIKES